jgi:cytochrome P450
MADAWDPDAFDPHDRAFLADPYPTYARFRAEAPVHAVKPYDSYWVFRHADVERVLTDRDTFVKTPLGGWPPAPGPLGAMASFPEGLFASDPPRHTALRKTLEPLVRQAVQGAPELATGVSAHLLDGVRKRGGMELISDYALPLPATVLFDILGIPGDPLVRKGLIAWQAAIVAAHDITQAVSLRATGATCKMALSSFFAGLVLGSRTAPPAGLLGEMCSAIGRDGLTAEDVEVCSSDFLVAGYLSTTFLIGTGVRTLLANPDQLQDLAAHPDLMPGAVEELLRYDAPAQLVDRVAAVDTELGGVSLKAGSEVTAVLGSANRDPERFAEPDRFLIRREDQGQVSFGDGIHHCIGAPLVRLVAPVAFAQLLELPDLALAGLPQWQTDPYLRAVTNLPLRLG